MTSRFAVLPTRVLYDVRMTPDVIYVLAGLASFSDKDNTSKVRQSILAGILGLSRDTVNARMRRLEDAGYVTQTRTGRTSLYQIVMDATLPAEFLRPQEGVLDATSGTSDPTSDVGAEDASDVGVAATPYSTVLSHRSIPPLASAPPKEHPAVLLYRDTARLWPDRALRPEIAKTVGDKPEDLERWKEYILTWIRIGWNKRNVGGMLDCFRQGTPPHIKRLKPETPGADVRPWTPIDKVLEERHAK